MTGVVGAAGGLGGFFLPTILGFFKDAAGSYGVGFFIFSFVSLCALILLRVVQQGWDFARLLPKMKLEVVADLGTVDA